MHNHRVMKLIGYESPELNAVFAALADPTRRAILARLCEGEANVRDLAEPFEMSQPAVSKHLKVLEASGLIERGQVGQSRPAYLKAAPMKEAVDWMEQFSRFWSGSFDQLDALLETIKSSEKDDLKDE
ncbi:MAG: metalloregulator ArsR/SmtB family transcription factor [Shimia sp.]|nr:metalloregulator ArsR/SmtB family transcription factor [Shimia sp.]